MRIVVNNTFYPTLTTLVPLNDLLLEGHEGRKGRMFLA